MLVIRKAPMTTECKHLWCNAEGCLLCGKGWKTLNEEGYYFQFVEAPPVPLTEKE